MPNRAKLLVAVLASAVAIPYLAEQRGQGLRPVQSWWEGMFENASPESLRMTNATPSPAPSGGGILPPSSQSLSGERIRPTGSSIVSAAGAPTADRSTEAAPGQGREAEVRSLAEILRFDVSPSWVTSTWPMVSHVARDQDLAGLRLPLVGGPRPQDITGALTYWFNAQHRCDRIDLWGTTGDPAEVIQVVTQGYGLTAEPSLGSSVHLGKNAQGIPQSILRVRGSRQLVVTDPQRRYDVELELRRPGTAGSLSLGAVQRLRSDGLKIEFPSESARGKDSSTASVGSSTGGDPATAPLGTGVQGDDPARSAVSTPQDAIRRRPHTEMLFPRNR